MPIVQTGQGPKPTLTMSGGTPTTLAAPSVPLGAFGRGLNLSGGRPISFAHIYRTQPWVASAANVLTRQTARLPIKTYEYLDANEEDKQRVRDHPAAIVLNRPRPRRRGVHWRAEMGLAIFVHGVSVTWKRRPSRGAPPYQLWALDWRMLTPHGDGGIVEFWEWSGRGVPDCPRFIDAADVIVVGWNSPESEIGVSPLEQLGVTIRSEDAIQRHTEAAFRNGTRMGVAAILDKSVNADKVERDGLRDELMDVHGGVDKVGIPAILGGGVVDLKPIGSQTAVEAELVRQRLVNREEVAAVYGVPQPIAGILDHGTYSNVRELHRILYVTFLGAHLEMFAASIQAQLIDDEPTWADDGVFVEFDLGAVLKGDTTERFAAYAVALQNGVLTLNDVRRLENMKPYDDPRANEPLIAANNIMPLSAIGNGQSTGDQVGKAIVDVIGDAVDRAMDRTVRAVGAGSAALTSFDPERVTRELRADLEAAGLNGASQELAHAVAGAIAADLKGALSVDDVRALRSLYVRSTR